MFWKECRENARWAALALLALSLGLAYAWFHLYQQSSVLTLGQVWSGENLVLTITTPLVGLALGLLQVLPELRRDQWAFLVHRPASRTTLFFGKALAGVCLYLLATTLPLLILAAWASSPSHVPAPFDFRFTLAGWAAILSGLPFYFAGLLVALRPARWYGSRALPLLTALLAPLAAAQLTEFLPVALISLLVLAPLLCAAWGSFVSGGEYTEQTKPARFVLGLALYPAILVVGVGALMLTVTAYNVLGGRNVNGSEWWRNEDKIDTQGRVFHVSERGDMANMNRKTVTVTDQAGHPVDPRVWQNFNQQHKLLDTIILFVHPAAHNYVMRYLEPSRYVLFLGDTYTSSRFTWYYDRPARQIVGYAPLDTGAYRKIYLGPTGSARESTPAGRFPDEKPYPTYIAGMSALRFRHSLFWYDLARPAAGLLQAAPGQDGILGTASSTEMGQAYGSAATLAASHPEITLVAADGMITVYSGVRGEDAPDKKRWLFTTPLAFGVSNAVQVAVTPDLSRFFFWYSQDIRHEAPDHVVTVASNGRVLKTEALPLPPQSAAQPARFIQGLPGLFAPPAATATAAVYAVIGHTLKDQTAEAWWRGFGRGGVFLSALFFSALGGLVAAVPAWLISRRLGDGRRGQIAWALGVFWLGGYGVLLLLALRAWPARVPCPNCGRERVVDNEACEHCGAAFARPRRDGTEIFDAEGREAAAR